ncbi:hypothetical protein TBR22_A20020 [Luteitalea sp. TBR-22]|nr:hypothetical protein TBR22_A20020 [Luteitalea sp. TBR-22]
MSISNFEFRIAAAAPRRRAARALLFVALSGVAVPACQYEGGTDAAAVPTTASAARPSPTVPPVQATPPAA